MQVAKHPIWEILQTQGRTKAWLARKTGYNYQHVKNLAAGRYATSPIFRQRCADLLQMPISSLFSDAADEQARLRVAMRQERRRLNATASLAVPA